MEFSSTWAPGILEPPILKPLPLPASRVSAAGSTGWVPFSSQETEAKLQSLAVLPGTTLIQPLRYATVLRMVVLPMEPVATLRSEEHTSELQSRFDLVCR